MQKLIVAAAVLLTSAAALAQSPKSIVFTGRFPFVSLDSVNERIGGSINRLEEFDLSIVTPGPSAFARSWVPTTAHQALMGDPTNTGNYTFFQGFKTYFQRINLAGPFVKDADRSSASADEIYWTLRDREAALQIDVLTVNGTTPYTLQPGDFIRLDCNGNVEFFVTQAQLATAAGPTPPAGSGNAGASAICQDALGNLYYSPAEGGHWVTGNNFAAGPVFANDGSIVMIDAASITYDANGNVSAIVADSAHILWEEVGVGPAFGMSVRQMVTNAGHATTNSTPSTFANMVGLDLDPNGGSLQAAYPVGDNPQVFFTVPNFVWCSDNGTYGGTIFSSANNGSIAVINGVTTGGTVAPYTGTHLGAVIDVGNFQPTLMGFCIIDAPAAAHTVLDTPNLGALPPLATQATWEVDCQSAPASVVFLLVTFGPTAPGGVASCLPTQSLPFAPILAPGSSPHTFILGGQLNLGFQVADPNGYAYFGGPNFHTGPFTGATLVFQAASLIGASFQVSNPVMMQLK